MEAAELNLQEKVSLEEPGLVLGQEEKAVLQSQMASPTSWHNPALFLLSCTSTLDGIIIILSAIAAIIGGAANPFALVSALLSRL
jgi:ATP-binding cassette subfamily B (MDR/TAP) protein 1